MILAVYNHSMYRQYAKILFFAVVIGVFAGVMSTAFHAGVSWATHIRKMNSWIIFLLPLAGVFIAAVYHTVGKDVEGGNNLILDEIHNPKKKIPFKMAPLIMISAITSHLFGASVGREGTAVQMGASLSDQFSQFYTNRKLLLMMGMSAGFASIFQTPLAGTLFALEVLTVGSIQYEALFPCLVTSFAGFLTARELGLTPFHAGSLVIPDIDFANLIFAAIAGITFGLTARAFSFSVHGLKELTNRKIRNVFMRPLIGGCFLISVYLLSGHDRYLGLGEEVIVESFDHLVPAWDFLAKMLTTAVSVATGFKGGEVMALFYIGSTSGNALSNILPGSVSFYSALGFSAVFAGAANTPLTGIVLAMEIFGPQFGVFAAITVTLSYFLSGTEGLYRSQKKGKKFKR